MALLSGDRKGPHRSSGFLSLLQRRLDQFDLSLNATIRNKRSAARQCTYVKRFQCSLANTLWPFHLPRQAHAARSLPMANTALRSPGQVKLYHLLVVRLPQDGLLHPLVLSTAHRAGRSREVLYLHLLGDVADYKEKNWLRG